MPKKPHKITNRRKLKKPMSLALNHESSSSPRHRYQPPKAVWHTSLAAILKDRPRPSLKSPKKGTLDMFSKETPAADTEFWYSGHLELLNRPCVAIVGTRDVSPSGAARARRLARELVQQGIVIVSGLAFGVDTEAHTAAIAAGGSTVAVIGTPLNKCSPSENAELQETIYADHLLISQFKAGSNVFASNFPVRNKLMAALADVTVIVEASDTSGTLHQAAECAKLGRHLGIVRAVVEDNSLNWPADFFRYDSTFVVGDSKDVLNRLGVKC
jgi:DNA processing protein